VLRQSIIPKRLSFTKEHRLLIFTVLAQLIQLLTVFFDRLIDFFD
jgi:hypothetical protein